MSIEGKIESNCHGIKENIESNNQTNIFDVNGQSFEWQPVKLRIKATKKINFALRNSDN